ncbi:MAG: nuclear transport factor 2 family protein [Rhodospirillales bacterium]
MSTPQDRYRRYLENLSPETLAVLGDYVSPDVRFKDPFNDVRGVEAMRRVFLHLFENISAIRFTVKHMATDGNVCLMDWRFEGQLRGKPWSFDGASVVSFRADGLVSEHIDHWDAARDFYEHLPFIGWLLGRLRGRLAVRQAGSSQQNRL